MILLFAGVLTIGLAGCGGDGKQDVVGAGSTPTVSTDEATMKEIVGFPISEKTAQDNGNSHSYNFKAPIGAGAYADANISVSVQKHGSLDDVKQTIQNMSSDAEVVAMDTGDGGYYLVSGGFFEMRALPTACRSA